MTKESKHGKSESDGRLSNSRRGFLRKTGVLTTLATVGGAGVVNASKQNADAEYKQLRGTVSKPLTPEKIQSIRDGFINKDGGTVAALNLESSLVDDIIVGYNIIRAADGRLREQYVTYGNRNAAGVDVNSRSSKPTVSQRLTGKADKLLNDAITEEEKRSNSTQEVTTTSEDWDIDWNSWSQVGSTEVYWEGAEKTAYGGKPGNAKFTHDVRESPDYDRLAARSKVRMEPGRQLCNDGLDAYCTSTQQDGYSNRDATVYHRWDQPVNSVDQNDVIVSTDPEGQVSDVTSTETYSLGLGLSSQPSLSIGFSSSVSFPGASITDKTSLTTGHTEHELEMNSPLSPSAQNTAVFEVGSVGAYNKGCTTSPPLQERSMLKIDVDYRYAFAIDGTWSNSWGDTQEYTKSFDYTTWC